MKHINTVYFSKNINTGKVFCRVMFDNDTFAEYSDYESIPQYVTRFMNNAPYSEDYSGYYMTDIVYMSECPDYSI